MLCWMHNEEDVLAMKLAECCNGTNNYYVPKDQDKFDFSCHDPFKTGGIKMYRK